jgi:Rieske Fe-S protein
MFWLYRLTENAIPEAPVQDSVRRILAQLVLVEKHCQHLGCLGWWSLARDKRGPRRERLEVQPRRSSRTMERVMM